MPATHCRGSRTADFLYDQYDSRECEPRVVPPHPQGLQGSHLNLSQASAQRHRRYFLLNNKAVNQGSHLNLSQTSAQRHTRYFLLNNKAVNTSRTRTVTW